MEAVNSEKTKKKHLNTALPKKMTYIRGIVDPKNPKNHYIFGSQGNNECWKYNYETQEYIELKNNIPKHINQYEVNGHECAYFEIKNNNHCDQFALIYGGSYGSSCYSIYEFENEKWNLNACKLNNKFIFNQNIMFNLDSKYCFQAGLSMITDIFQKNKIHICGGRQTLNKYGYFIFNHEILSNPDLGIICSFLCVYVFFIGVVL